MNKREYRAMEFQLRSESEEPSYIIEGYASTFDEYVLFEADGIEYKERILPEAFNDCDMTDVVFRVDHEGKVYARTSNGLIELAVDEHGLHQRTDLSKTESARQLYEEIKAGNYPQMSFAFMVEEDSYDQKSHTRTISKISKLYDVAAVAFPANPHTDLSARSYFDGVIEMEKAERLEAEKRRKELRRKLLKENLEND